MLSKKNQSEKTTMYNPINFSSDFLDTFRLSDIKIAARI